MDAPKIMFRKKMGGYNKEDVNNYITSENQRFKRMEADFHRALEERDEEISRAQEELNMLRRQTNDLSITLVEKNRLIEGYKESVELLQAKVEELQETIVHLEEVKNDEIYEKKEVIVDSSIFDKARAYDSLCTQIDEILSYAKSEADRIITTAVDSAKRIEHTRGSDVTRIKS